MNEGDKDYKATRNERVFARAAAPAANARMLILNHATSLSRRGEIEDAAKKGDFPSRNSMVRDAVL